MTRRSTLIVLGIALCGVLLYVLFGRSDYHAFDLRREAWHLRCDRYVDAPALATTPAALDCGRELQELLAYARRKGWQ